MQSIIDLFNKFRDIQNTPLDGRIAENFDLYKELFETFTVKDNQELNNLKINLHFYKDRNCKFEWIVDEKYLDIVINLNTVPTEDFDDFIFRKKEIDKIIENCCYKSDFNSTWMGSDGEFGKAYDSWNSYLVRIGYDEKNLISSPEIDKMKASLNKYHVVWCHNKSCSGKTYAAIGLLKQNKKCAVFNPCFQSSCDYEFVRLLLSVGKDFSLLIDDIQCDIEKAREIMEYICNNYHQFITRNIKVFIVSWSSLLTESDFKRFASILPTYTTNPSDYIELLKDKINDESLLTVCGENIALLNAASKVNGEISKNSKERLFRVFVCTDDIEKIKQIHKLCVLGVYEYSASQDFLGVSTISSDDINTLKITGTRYYAGHREICQFIASYIEQLGISGLQERHAIIQEYIKSIDNTQKWKTLKQLVGENSTDDLSAVSPIWNTLNCFEQEIKIQTQKDPSWGNTPSSMYFVLNTATLLGIADEYQNVLRAFCSKFILSEKEPFISLKYDKIKTTNDFTQIRLRMIEEDGEFDNMAYERGEDFDCNMAHKNWVLGLIVGLKKELMGAGYEELYTKAVNDLFSAQKPDGFWYPRRIPWVTARIIIGLSQAGFSVNNNHHMKRAVNYLFEELGNNSFWEAHTGGWNSIYETSSLCLEAIFKSGYECRTNHAILRVSNYLLQNKEVWMAKDNEIDGSATACSLLKIIGIKRDLLKYITDLCERCIFDSVQRNESLDLNQLQSCNTTQIASYTIELCWYILERDLPSLLEQFLKRSCYKEEFKVMADKVKKIFISYSEDSISHIKRIKKISDRLKAEGHNVFFYADAPLGTNNVDFMQNIENCDIIIIIGTPKYKEKAMKIKKGGVYFEENVIGASYMSEKYESIIPISFGEFSDSFPPPFNLNKGVHCKRVDTNFLNKLVEEIDKK